ncbi:hypothetical protein ACIBHX_41460 [Nonomuraea sp. NPDC050536]|uniref:hypothetical protein n=1 Tax=Nonomuraea sp. NPDC050536 TaxID=3364366 RepID=UPI0037C665FE
MKRFVIAAAAALAALAVSAPAAHAATGTVTEVFATTGGTVLQVATQSLHGEALSFATAPAVPESVAVSNRTDRTVTVFQGGRIVGTIPAGQSGTVSLAAGVLAVFSAPAGA